MPVLTYADHAITWNEHSSGEHTFIFINGYSASQLIWQHEIELLKPLGRCVTLDLPGHYPARVLNNSNQLTQEMLIELETYAVKCIVEDGSATLVGHSTGGLAALGVAAKLHKQVNRVICIAPVVWGPLRGLIGFAHHLLTRGQYSVFRALWGITQITPTAFMLGFSFYVHDRVAHWRNERAWNVCRYAYPWYKRHNKWNLAMVINMLAVCDIRIFVSQVTMPVLVMAGDNDPVVPPRQTYWLAERLPDATLHMFEKTGHVPQVEQHLQWEQVAMDWLAAHRV
jgi:pimeloyl-ACP methyl ester carboxylesterase